jgi:hypothetical protein
MLGDSRDDFDREVEEHLRTHSGKGRRAKNGANSYEKRRKSALA